MLKKSSVHLGSTMGKETDQFVQSFWYWNKFSNYILTLLCMVAVFGFLTAIFQESPIFIMLIGSASSGIEVSHVSLS